MRSQWESDSSSNCTAECRFARMMYGLAGPRKKRESIGHCILCPIGDRKSNMVNILSIIAIVCTTKESSVTSMALKVGIFPLPAQRRQHVFT